ncbi:MAG: ATP-binding cassette domain-containing protein [Polyangiaceae bacterium]|nr:ATP-binding cassette domain-containing protein [Polyangiaceae bacterium]
MSDVEAKETEIAAEALFVERGARTVLRGVDIAVVRGEVLGVLGPSGSGKSTLFQALAGETDVVSGRVTFRGADVTAQTLWQRAGLGLGYMPQEPSVFWDLTVRQNLALFAQVRRTPARPTLAEEVGLDERLDVPARSLSAGERRRLEFARAVTGSPTVLICDEPFAGVDPIGAERLGQMLAKLAATGVAVLLADHHVEEALSVCTRALLLLDGEVAAAGTPEEFRNHPTVQGRYLGTWRRSLPPPRPTA